MFAVKKCLQYYDEFLVFAECDMSGAVLYAWCVSFALAAASVDISGWDNERATKYPECRHAGAGVGATNTEPSQPSGTHGCLVCVVLVAPLTAVIVMLPTVILLSSLVTSGFAGSNPSRCHKSIALACAQVASAISSAVIGVTSIADSDM